MNEKMILEEARYQLNFVTEEKETTEIEGFLLESLIELIEKKNKKIQELSKKDKVIDLIYNLFYEYISIRPMSGIKFINDKGFSKCKNCEIELKDENSISCKECIKEQFFKKAEE